MEGGVDMDMDKPLPLSVTVYSCSCRMEARMDLKRCGSCAILTMKFGENKISTEFIKSFHEALDRIENLSGVTHLVTTGEDKHYSTGVDLNTVQSTNPQHFIEVLSDLQKLLARLITFPLVTVAAINGHCVGGGAMLALSHDCRVMRSDRGWFFVPIVRLGHTLPVALLNLAKSRLSQPTLHHMVITSLRYSAEDGKKAGFIDRVMSPCQLVDGAVQIGAELAKGKSRESLQTVKCDLYHELCQTLTEPCRFNSNL